jgi:hypothetical protein
MSYGKHRDGQLVEAGVLRTYQTATNHNCTVFEFASDSSAVLTAVGADDKFLIPRPEPREHRPEET